MKKKNGNGDETLRIGGIVSQNRSFSGRLFVERDLLIPKGITIEINEGTEIFVEKADISRTEPVFLMPENEILVEGTLIIKGTKENPVRISSLDKVSIDWGGIIINGGVLKGENVEISNSYTAFNLIKGFVDVKDFKLFNNKIAIAILNDSKASFERGELSNNETGIVNVSTNSFLKDLVVKDNEEGVLLRRCPDKVVNLLANKNLFGVIANKKCINFNLLNIKSYGNQDNLIFADITD